MIKKRKYNKPWLQQAVKRNDIIKVATEPIEEKLTYKNATNAIKNTGFGNEINYLKSLGYEYDSVTKTMIKKAK